MAMSGGIRVSGSCKTKLWKGSRQFLSADSVFTEKMRGGYHLREIREKEISSLFSRAQENAL